MSQVTGGMMSQVMMIRKGKVLESIISLSHFIICLEEDLDHSITLSPNIILLFEIKIFFGLNYVKTKRGWFAFVSSRVRKRNERKNQMGREAPPRTRKRRKLERGIQRLEGNQYDLICDYFVRGIVVD